MATKITKCDPTTLTSDPKKNYSRSLPPEKREAAVIEKAIQLLTDGQTEPIHAQGTADKPGNVFAGTTRLAAAQLIRRGFEVPTGQKDEEGKDITAKYHDPNFTIDVIFEDVDDEEAAVRNITSNFNTDKPNDVDLAHAARAVQNQFNWTDAEVTRRFGISDPNKVRNVKHLLKYPEAVQQQVREGVISTQAAISPFVTKKTEAGQAAGVEAVKAAAREGKAVTAAAVQKVVRDADDGKATDGGSATGQQRKVPSGAEIRDLLQRLVNEMVEEADPAKADVLSGLSWINKFCHGGVKETTFAEKFDEKFGFASPKAAKPRKSKARAAAEEAVGAASGGE